MIEVRKQNRATSGATVGARSQPFVSVKIAALVYRCISGSSKNDSTSRQALFLRDISGGWVLAPIPSEFDSFKPSLQSLQSVFHNFWPLLCESPILLALYERLLQVRSMLKGRQYRARGLFGGLVEQVEYMRELASCEQEALLELVRIQLGPEWRKLQEDGAVAASILSSLRAKKALFNSCILLRAIEEQDGEPPPLD